MMASEAESGLLKPLSTDHIKTRFDLLWMGKKNFFSQPSHFLYSLLLLFIRGVTDVYEGPHMDNFCFEPCTFILDIRNLT